jgi:protocatechuate 3,4-dioxygenase beta subunit
LLLACAVGLAQQSTGTILGTVSDPSSANVPGVHVTLTNEDTQDKRDTLTDQLGDYRFTFVPPGTYSVRAELKGFQSTIVEHLILRVNDERRQDFVLKVGAVTSRFRSRPPRWP